MLWEGIRVYSRSQYEALSPKYRFILTEEVRDKLHPDLPEKYIGKSLILITSKKKTEIEVEGINFIIVDDNVEDYTLMSLRDAERRYPDEMTECRLTGASIISKLFQEDQTALIEKKIGTRKPLASKSVRKTKTAEKEADADLPPAPVTAELPVPPSKRRKTDIVPVSNDDEPVTIRVKKRKAVRSDGIIRPLWKPKS